MKLGEKFDRLQTQTPRTLFRDERIWRLGSRLAEQVERPDEYSELYAESLIVMLFIDLLRLGDAAERASRSWPRAGHREAPAPRFAAASLSSPREVPRYRADARCERGGSVYPARQGHA